MQDLIVAMVAARWVRPPVSEEDFYRSLAEPVPRPLARLLPWILAWLRAWLPKPGRQWPSPEACPARAAEDLRKEEEPAASASCAGHVSPGCGR